MIYFRKTIHSFFLFTFLLHAYGWLFTGCTSAKRSQPEVLCVDTMAEMRPVETRLILTFSGDYMQHIPQVNAARTRDGQFDYTQSLQHMKPFFGKADYSVINLETTLAAGGYTGYPRFRSPKENLTALKSAGINVLALANNHCCDNGLEGVKYTVGLADSCGFRYTGVYVDTAGCKERELLMLTKGDIRVALLNYTYGTNGLPIPAGVCVNLIDTALIAGDIDRARKQGASDIIVLYHWGEEYSMRPGVRQRGLAEWTCRQGAAFVIGSHPHVIQPFRIEQKDSAISNLTLFSMGNFISNQSDIDSRGGLSFYIELVKEGSGATRYENAAYLLHWVHRPLREGRKRYEVIPAFLADSILNGHEDYAAYQKFVQHARLAIGDPVGVTEMVSF